MMGGAGPEYAKQYAWSLDRARAEGFRAGEAAAGSAWTGGVLPQDVLTELGADELDDEDRDTVLTAYEEAYYDGVRHAVKGEI